MNDIPLYIPQGSKYLSAELDSEIRLGIQGYPFTGKTFAALTFPNPIPLSWDKKLGAHCSRTNMPIIPMYDGEFVDGIVRRDGIKCPPNQKDAIIQWLMTEGVKLAPQQTLIADGLTGIETAYHIWFKQHEDDLARTKKGEIDGRVEWNLKKTYFDELWNCVKGLKCNFILISHEQDARDKDGSYTGKIKPLLTGQSADKMGMNFTDWFGMHSISKPKDNEQIDKLVKWAGVDKDTIKHWCDATPPTYQAIHLWQTQGDSERDCGTSSLVNVPKYILANYETFSAFRRNKQETKQQ